MSTERSYKRRRFFNYSIKKQLQLRMLFKVWGIVFLSLVLAGAVFYFYSNINVGISYRLFHVKARNFLEFLLPVVVCGFFSSLILGVVVALFFPHAFAGPLHRIEKDLVDIGNGDLTKLIKLRKGSEVPDLANAINVMVADLRDQVRRINDTAEEISKLLEEGSAEDTERTLEKVNRASANLQAEMKKFRI
jgi:methyl-accepting chemotaxis protein